MGKKRKLIGDNNLYGNEIHSGLYTELQLISIFTKMDVDDLSINVCGAVCGAITNEYSDEADLHAKNYYGLVRSMSTDIYEMQLIENDKTQDEAHILAKKKYNYDKGVKDYHAKSGKY